MRTLVLLNAPQGDYRLRPDSSLMNAGDPDLALHDSDRSRSDIGAYGGPPPLKEGRRASAASSIFQELFGSPEILRSSLSASGLPGIIHVPTATTVPEGSLDVGYNSRAIQRSFLALISSRILTSRRVFAASHHRRTGHRCEETDTGTHIAGDISANAHFLLLEDKSWWPGIAVG